MISHLKHVICEKKVFSMIWLIFGRWLRINPMFLRAQTNQLFIIPIPGDPFALPSQNSDPIRGPIFVPLNTECLRYIICFPIFHVKTYNCIVKFFSALTIVIFKKIFFDKENFYFTFGSLFKKTSNCLVFFMFFALFGT